MDWRRILPRGLQHHLQYEIEMKALDIRLAEMVAFKNARKHNLPGELIVSLTSHAPRFPLLHQGLRCVLDQSVRPDRTILWIDADEMHLLPDAVTSLRDFGLTIASYDAKIRSFTKLIPALEKYPEAFIVTADDDVGYDADWLSRLIEDFDPDHPDVMCMTAYRPTFAPDGALAPYLSWEINVSDPESLRPSNALFPLGSGGVLYPPGSLGQQVLDRELFMSLTPLCDDTWFHFMRQKAGTKARRVNATNQFTGLRAGAVNSLWDRTAVSIKDDQLAAMVRRFGAPLCD